MNHHDRWLEQPYAEQSLRQDEYEAKLEGEKARLLDPAELLEAIDSDSVDVLSSLLCALMAPKQIGESAEQWTKRLFADADKVISDKIDFYATMRAQRS